MIPWAGPLNHDRAHGALDRHADLLESGAPSREIPPMNTRPLGRTGLFVSELCLGTMTFGGSEGLWAKIGALGQAESERLVGQALDAGINVLDTADVYGAGASEEITGRALANLKVPRDQVVVATKVLAPMGPGPNARGASRGHILDGLAASLRRLKLEHVDLYQLHGFDPATPIEESLRALDQVVRDGRVRYIGLSNWAAWQIAKALGIVERLGLARPASLQAYYSLAGRDLEREIVPMLASEEVGLMVWSPLAGGLLSGKYSREQPSPAGARRSGFDFPPVDRERAWRVIDVLRQVATAHQRTVAQVALAWLLHQPAVTSIIVGATKPEQLADNLAASGLRLAPAELAALNEASALVPEYPGWMLARQAEYRSAPVPGAARLPEDPGR